MSWEHIVAARGRAADGQAQAVLLLLATYADEEGKCWPSQLTLSRETCLARSTVQLALSRLQSAGLVVLLKRGKTNRQAAVYCLKLTSPTAMLASQPVQSELARESVIETPLARQPGTTSPAEPSDWPDSRAQSSQKSSIEHPDSDARARAREDAPARRGNGTPEARAGRKLDLAAQLAKHGLPDEAARQELIKRRRREAEELSEKLTPKV